METKVIIYIITFFLIVLSIIIYKKKSKKSSTKIEKKTVTRDQLNDLRKSSAVPRRQINDHISEIINKKSNES